MTDYQDLRHAVAVKNNLVTVTRVELALLLAEVDKLRATQVKKPRVKKAKPVADTLPDWLPLAPWMAFLEMRTKIKKPPTDYAKTLLIKKLTAFYANDLDPSVILNQSTLNSWQDLYAPKEASTAYRGAGRAPVAEQNAANNAAALRLLGRPNFDPDDGMTIESTR
jgi:hypothetical protein